MPQRDLIDRDEVPHHRTQQPGVKYQMDVLLLIECTPTLLVLSHGRDYLRASLHHTVVYAIGRPS